ncbi:MAG: hypothetical protein MJ236_07435 [Clostridia bacterium]|nr:hypothetical protein [Clostridia bacterium]
MKFAMTIFIAIGLALGVYGYSTCKGALLGRFNRIQPYIAVLVFATWQILVLSGGKVCSAKLLQLEATHANSFVNGFLCILLFSALAFKMFRHGFQNITIEERRMDEKELHRLVLQNSLKTGLITFLIGFSIGIVDLPFIPVMVVCFVLAVLGVLAGLLVGYHFGYGQRMGAYIASGLFLALGDVLMILHCF